VTVLAEGASPFHLCLLPSGHLRLEDSAEAPPLEPAAARRLAEAFAAGSGAGLLRLGAGEIGQALPPVFAWWRDFAARYVAALCHQEAGGGGDGAEAPAPLAEPAPPDEAELTALVLAGPLMPGAEYLTPTVLRHLWRALHQALAAAQAGSGLDLQGFLHGLNPAWTLVGRVYFNLAENRRDPEAPFAFMATYTTRLGPAGGKAQHVALGQALRDYAGAADRDALLSLLQPIQRASERCDWLKAMVETGEIFHPLRWSPAEAARLLASAPLLEAAGVILRMPPSWRAGRPSRPRVKATVGAQPPSATGLDGLLDFQMEVALDGAPLTEAECAALLAGSDGLVLLRGQWVEVDRDRLDRTLTKFGEVEALARRHGLTFAEAMRLLAGMSGDDEAGTETDEAHWAEIGAGPWLARTLAALRAPEGSGADPGPALKATLRPYQQAGVAWLRLLSGLGLGACLADDMGLGKTIQVLALLLLRRREAGETAPCLLVAPASLLANWGAEIDRFAPDLKVVVAHPSAQPPAGWKSFGADQLAGAELVLTSYGTLPRLPWLAELSWPLLVLDEAQAIKNPGAKQTRAVKQIRAQARIALTGTPVENRPGDLWSIFDAINPGLLGTARQFTRYTKSLAERPHNPYGPLRALVRPYILRRMKTDPAVIADLPDKTELTAFCSLSRKQAALYAQTVTELERALKASDGIQRQGLVLATLTRLKQICNHPSHWLGDDAWAEEHSGKLLRLREIAETVAARQEKMLLFTQFREITAPLAAFLGGVFGRPGLVLHGGTRVRERHALVERFQQDETVPFFVLSLKAGGTGLTLTAASHVVHFDRWWNPAVENQATDRAFRIGQQRNVLVHKFVCRGTIEEKIDALIDSKKSLSRDLLTGGDELKLTELPDADLLRLVALDLNAVMKD
jgi:non-specific serine/threonine protein kinase